MALTPGVRQRNKELKAEVERLQNVVNVLSNNRHLGEVAANITTHFFTVPIVLAGDQVDRLAIITKAGQDLGGWGRFSMRTRIFSILQEAFQSSEEPVTRRAKKADLEDR